MRSINSGFAFVTDAKAKNMSATIKLVLDGEAYQMFIDSSMSPKTKQTYESSLRSYMLFRKVSLVEPMLFEDTKQPQSME